MSRLADSCDWIADISFRQRRAASILTPRVRAAAANILRLAGLPPDRPAAAIREGPWLSRQSTPASSGRKNRRAIAGRQRRQRFLRRVGCFDRATAIVIAISRTAPGNNPWRVSWPYG